MPMVQPGNSWSPTLNEGQCLEDSLEAKMSRCPKTLTNILFLSLWVTDAFSPTKGNTRNVKKLEDRKTDPLSLEGYVSSSLPKPPEKGKGEDCSMSHSDVAHGMPNSQHGRTQEPLSTLATQ